MTALHVANRAPDQGRHHDYLHAQMPDRMVKFVQRALPLLLYERLDEIGLDFAVLYPSSFMLFAPFIRDSELRRAFDIYAAEQFREF